MPSSSPLSSPSQSFSLLSLSPQPSTSRNRPMPARQIDPLPAFVSYLKKGIMLMQCVKPERTKFSLKCVLSVEQLNGLS